MMVVPRTTGIFYGSGPMDLALIMLDGVLSRSLMYSGLMCGELIAPSYWAAAGGLLAVVTVGLTGLMFT